MKERFLDGYSMILLTASFLLLVVVVSWIAIERIEQQSKGNARESLQTVLHTTQESLHLWVNHRKKIISDLVIQQEFVELTQKLLQESQQNQGLKSSEALAELRKNMEPVLVENDDNGFLLFQKSESVLPRCVIQTLAQLILFMSKGKSI